MKKGDLVKFKEVKDAGDEKVIMRILWVDHPRAKVEALVDMNYLPTAIYAVEELEVV